jgi:prephenate dehydrogenase
VYFLKVTIIGGAGRMGRFFLKYFISKKNKVIVSDENKGAEKIVKKEGGLFSFSNRDSVNNSDLTLISVPLDTTLNVIDEVVPYIKKGSVVVEISSVKGKTVDILKGISNKGITTISLHPLFGSGSRSLKGKKMALIPVVNEKIEKTVIKKIFPEAIIESIGVEEHDRIMALILSLPHFLNLAFASTLSKENISLLRKFAGPTFTMQLLLSESIFSDTPDLYASIQISNKNTIFYLNKFIKEANLIKKMIEFQNHEKFISLFNKVKKNLKNDIKINKPYEIIYGLLEK